MNGRWSLSGTLSITGQFSSLRVGESLRIGMLSSPSTSGKTYEDPCPIQTRRDKRIDHYLKDTPGLGLERISDLLFSRLLLTLFLTLVLSPVAVRNQGKRVTKGERNLRDRSDTNINESRHIRNTIRRQQNRRYHPKSKDIKIHIIRK